MKRRLLPLLPLLVLALLPACGRPPGKAEEIRPVRTITVGAVPGELGDTYAGEVRPRYESDLGFRVSGKILSRLVNIGDTVRSGQVLARLDPKDLDLNEASGRAQLAALDAQLAVARSDYERNKRLFDQGVIGQAGLDHYEATYRAAEAQVRAAHAQLDTASNQAGYAELRADHDGVITAVAGEPGQVVAAGQAVVRLAHAGEIEVASSIPEDQIARMHPGLPVEVSLWAHPEAKVAGRIRELASSADPATRTYALRVSVPQPPPEMKLGMTASVRIPQSGVPDLIRLPFTALVEQQGQKGVWTYDAKTSSVVFRPIAIAGVSGNDLLVGAGLHDGDIVVTAGAPLLLPGQKVKLLQSAAASG